MIKIALFAAVLSLGLHAQTVAKREVNQQARINEGVRSGTLTKAEAARLNAQQAALRKEVRRDRIDGGGLSTAERAQINRQQNRQSTKIVRQKADGQTRP